MRRLFAILLLAVLPFQLAWASAAAYCEHEAGAVAVSHFGHHMHSHSVSSDDSDLKLKLKVHHDCSVCNAVAGHAVLQQLLYLPGPTEIASVKWSLPGERPGVPPNSVPDRPQWLGLA
jgi:hypothetical protein